MGLKETFSFKKFLKDKKGKGKNTMVLQRVIGSTFFELVSTSSLLIVNYPKSVFLQYNLSLKMHTVNENWVTIEYKNCKSLFCSFPKSGFLHCKYAKRYLPVTFMIYAYLPKFISFFISK